MRWVAICAMLLGLVSAPQSIVPAAAAANTRAGQSQLPENEFRIAGIVVDALSGQPLVGATVSITRVGSAEAPEIISSSDDGGFAFENVAPGKYSLQSRHKGYLIQTYKQHESFSTAIIVRPGVDTEHLRFEMRPGGSISGQITDEMNEPVRGARVTLWRRGLRGGERGTRLFITAISDDEGRYFFGHLAEGTYFVSVSATPWYADHNPVGGLNPADSSGDAAAKPRTDPMLDVVYPVTYFPNASALADASPISIRAGETETADLNLRPVPAISVRVKLPQITGENKYVQVAQVLNSGQEEGIPYTQEQHGDVVELHGIPPGTVRISVVDPSGRDAKTRSETLRLTSSQEIAAPDSTDAVSITGSMRMDDCSPLQLPAMLWLELPGRQRVFSARANSSGMLDVTERDIPPGTYEVSLPQPRECVITSLTAAGAKVQGRSVEFVAGQNVNLIVVISKGAAEVKGFTLKGDKPVDGVMVVLVPEDAAHSAVLFRRDQSDSDGSFDIGLVVPGKYTAVAIENGWDLAWSEPAVLKEYLAAGEKLSVAPNGKYDLKLNVQ